MTNNTINFEYIENNLIRNMLYRGIKVKYISRSSKIKLTDERFNESKRIAYKYTGGNTLEQAIDYLAKNGFKIVGCAEMKNEYIVFCDNWGDKCIRLNDIKK